MKILKAWADGRYKALLTKEEVEGRPFWETPVTYDYVQAWLKRSLAAKKGWQRRKTKA